MRNSKKLELERIEKMKERLEKLNDSFWKNRDEIQKSEKERMAQLTKKERINWMIADIMIKTDSITRGLEELLQEIKQ